MALAVVVLLTGFAWRSAEASGRRTLPGGCRVAAGSSGPDHTLGLAPAAEGTPPEGWTEASTRGFDWDGDGTADHLRLDAASGEVLVQWSSGSLTITGVSIPVAGASAGLGGRAATDEEPEPVPAGVADVTGDGWPDLLVVSHGEVRVLAGPGPATDQVSTLDLQAIGTSTAPGWISPPIALDGQPQIPYDSATIRPLWDLDADGADDFAVVSNDRRAAGPIARYHGRACAGLPVDERSSHRPGAAWPESVGGPRATGTTVGTEPPTAPTTAPQPPRKGRDSVLGVDTPDPSILRQSSTYYLFTTNAYFGNTIYNVPVHRSTTLWSWDAPADALPNVGSWSNANHTGKVWAPVVHQFGATYVLYYVARVKPGLGADNRQCIGRATSTSPAGPFSDADNLPLVCQSLLGGSIDPDVFVDGNGVAWLLFKNDGNCCGLPAALWSMQLTADGHDVSGPATELFTTSQSWESPTIENPAMVNANGVTWLFYSANNWDSANYAMGYGWCWLAAGPCSKTTTAGPWLSNATTDYAKGPGGGDFFTDANGGWWVAYHGWYRGVGYANGAVRALFIDKVDFDTNAPVIDSSVGYETIIPKPPKVTGLTLAQNGHNSARARWNPITTDPPPTGYGVSAQEVGGSQIGLGCGSFASGSVSQADLGCLRDGHTYDVTVTAQNANGPGPPSDPVRIALDETGARFVGVTPSRVLDTRDGTGMPGGGTSHVGPGQTVTLSLGGRGGLPPPAQLSGVVLSLTVTDPSAPSHLRVYPGDAPSPPNSSSINFGANDTIAAMVTAATAPDGTVKIFNNSGQAHIIADVVGYYGVPNGSTGALHRSLTPARVLDTRDGLGLPGATPARIGAQQSITLDLADHGGLPAAGAFSSVILNVTAVQGSRLSHVRVYPGDQTSPPFASSLNFQPGQTIANLVTVRAAPNGTVKLYNQSGDVDLVADVVGYYGPLEGTQGARFYAEPPSRVIDTRWWPPDSGQSPLGAGVPLAVGLYHPSLGYDEVMSSAVLTITVDQPSSDSHLTVWPYEEPLPTASNLNFTAGQVIANQASVKVGTVGQPPFQSSVVNVQNNAGTVQVIADLNGWFGPEAP